MLEKLCLFSYRFALGSPIGVRGVSRGDARRILICDTRLLSWVTRTIIIIIIIIIITIINIIITFTFVL